MNRVWPCFIVFASLFSYCSAEVFVSESFDYDLGSVDGRDGGTGWSDSWFVSDGLFDTNFTLDVIEPSEPLVYAIPGGGFINGGDRALHFSNDDPEATLANDSNALTRPFDLPVIEDEVYFSFLYRYEGDGTETGGFINNNDFVVWWFNSAGGPTMGLKGNRQDGGGVDDFVGRVNGGFAPPQQVFAPGGRYFSNGWYAQ